MSLSRVIEVSFNGGSIAYVKADTAYFYNNGILFKPTDLDLPASYQVHWADSPQASSTLETIGTAEGAPIPDDLWNRSRVIYGWIYLHPTENSAVTAYEVRIYKNVRAGLPDGTEPTPAEQSTIDQLIGALNSAVEQTAQDKANADASAQSASASASSAAASASKAATSAGQAAASATSAGQSAVSAAGSATSAGNSAGQAAQIKTDIEGYVSTAQTAAQTATDKAAQASQSATNASNSATTASTKAGEASASATTASNKAGEASASATTASNKATEASGYANTASQKASDASDSASAALGYKTAAQTAQGLAENARDTAVSAKTDAESARDDAETARDEAQQAVASISGALAEKAPIITDTASGAIASFSDGADDLPLKSLVVDINPVQDLHGQENPYPAGGGKNKFKFSDENRTAASYGVTCTFDKETETFTVTGTETRGSAFSLLINVEDFHIPNFVVGETYTISIVPTSGSNNNHVYCQISYRTTSANNNSLFTAWREKTTFTVPSNFDYIYNAFIGIYAGATDLNYSFKVQIEKGSEATAWSPYSNICPISGWTSVDVEQSGKNLFDSNFSDYTKPYNYYICPIKLENGKRYKMKAELVGTTITGASFGLVKSGNRYEEFVGPYYVVGVNGDTRDFNITVDDTFTAPKLVAYVSGENQFNEVLSNYNVMLMPYEQADYEPYSGQSINIALGQTVYGGKLDVLSGELTVDRAMVDLGTLNWTNEDPYLQGMARAAVGVADLGAVYSQTPLCSTLKGTSPNSYLQVEMGTVCFSNSPSTPFIRVRSQIFSGLSNAEIKTALTGVQFVYELATPIEIQLSANQINSLYGVNNLWADSGDTEVEYRADTKLYIAKKIAEALASLT